MRKGFLFCVLAVLLSGATCRPPSAPSPAKPFTIVVLPDTQHYSRRYPDLFMAQTQWIKQNRDQENIVFVSHMGDIVNDYGPAANQWKVAEKSMAVLDGVVPFGVTIGNHDYETNQRHPNDGATFVKYFGPKRFERYSWYGGASTNGLNSFQLFSAGGVDFIILHLQLDVPDFAIEWADQVLRAHSNRTAIVTTHSYLNGVSGVHGYNAPVSKFGNSAEEVWNKLIRTHPQIFMVLCGHHQLTVAYHQTSTNAAGHPVAEILADYQKGPHGGDAWLRLLQFDPTKKILRVRTYSPALKEFRTDPQNHFDVSLDIFH